jgi:hypothetical protein
VFTPFILAAKWVADRQPRDVFDHESWKRDLDLAIDKGHAFPDTANYWSVEYKKPRIKTEKAVKQKAPSINVAIAKS